MRTNIKLVALGAVAALMIAGMAMTLANENGISALNNDTPVVSIVNLGSEMNEEQAVMVTEDVNGETVPLSGVAVMVCRMNMSCDGEQTTMRVMEMTMLQTGEDGKVRYNFTEGHKYMICAENQNQRGFANMNMNQTEAHLCYQHQWEWGHMNGQTFTVMNQDGVQGSNMIRTMGQNDTATGCQGAL